MKPLKKKPPLEATIQNRIRKALELLGWRTWKIHGGRFQSGWPDLFCAHADLGVRWVEVKRPKTGKLTRGQQKRFAALESAGVGVWVLDGAEPTDLALIDGPPNWRAYE
jgi:hypothetical protein